MFLFTILYILCKIEVMSRGGFGEGGESGYGGVFDCSVWDKLRSLC